jgi:GTPase SAR1 family protein
METRVIAKGPLAIWVFGPVGAGKSLLISRLPLDAFRIVDQDALLEEELARRGLCLDATQHTATERTQFQSIRRQVAAALWNQVPVWRKEGINLCFETTGDKPHLFEAELIANRNPRLSDARLRAQYPARQVPRTKPRPQPRLVR